MIKTTTFLITLLVIFSMNSQTVTTLTDGTPDDGIGIDSNDNLYVSDIYGGKIFKFTPSGQMTEFASGLNYPNGIAVDSQDRIYSCEVFHNTSSTNSINRFLPDGTLDMSVSVTLNPSGIIKDFDSDDMIFAKYGGNSIHRLSPNGDGTATITTISDAPELNGPVGLAFDDNGELYVGNYENRNIYRVLTDGTLEYIATVGTSGNLGFIAFGQGMLWGTVLQEHKIYRINPNAVNDITLFAGSIGGTTDGDISVATFAAPNGINFNNAQDTMYISEFNSQNIRIISGINLSVNEFSNNNSFKIITNSNEAYLLLVGSIFETNSYKIIVSNVLGQKVFDKNKKSSSSVLRETIKTDTWPSGTYFISIQSDSFFETKKVIIK